MIWLVVAPDRELGLSVASNKAEETGNVVRVPDSWDRETFLLRLSSLSLLGTKHTYLYTEDNLLEGEPCLADRLWTLLTEDHLRHTLVLCATSARKHPLIDKLKEMGTFLEVGTGKGNDSQHALQNLLDAALARADASMDRDARNELLSRIGDNTGRLTQEVDKLAAFADGNVIEKDHVISLVADDSLEDFGLQNALRKKNPSDLGRCIRRLLEHGINHQAIFAQVSSEIRRLWILSRFIPHDKRNLSRNAFIHDLHPNLKEKRKAVAGLDDALARNWHNPYYMYYLYAAVQTYSPDQLERIMISLEIGRAHV